MGTALLAFGLAAAISLATSWVLVARLEMLGERLGLSGAALGLAAALAADAPEITAAITALAHRDGAVGAGVVLGSNVFNLAAILGLAAVVAGRVVLHRRVVALGGAVGVWIAGVCLLAVARVVPPAASLVLAALVLIAYGLALGARPSTLARLPLPAGWGPWLAAAVAEEDVEVVQALRPRRGTWRDGAVAGLCLVVVVGASVAMEHAAVSLGHRWHLAGIVVGGLVLAAVTSLPNAVAGAYLASRGRGSALLSTALNSNAFNVVVGLLLPATFTGLARPGAPGLLVVGAYAGLTAGVVAVAWVGRGLRRSEGWAVIFCYIGFVGALAAISR